MIIRVLGAAAGGGLPQWNCGCPNCVAARSGSAVVRPRTQSSVAISPDGQGWFLLNISPDIRGQIESFPPLGPAFGCARGTGIIGCILTDAEIDHTTGLLFLREGGAFEIFSTPLVKQIANESFSIAHVLSQFAPRQWREFDPECEINLRPAPDGDRQAGELHLRAFLMPEHLPRFAQQRFSSATGSVVGLEIADPRTGGRLVYAPCVGEWTAEFEEAVHRADVAMMDGTFWSDDELIRMGFGDRTALEMGHLPVGGANGSLDRFAALSAAHKLYVHINNTNPMLDESSPEFARVTGAGVRVACDGDTIEI